VQAVRTELGHLGAATVALNVEKAMSAYTEAAAFAALVTAGGGEVQALDYEAPEWVDLPFEDASISAPVIHAALASLESKTGLWRTLRPVVDYEHCKGCLVCVAVCPTHAILARPEHAAAPEETPP